MGEAKRVRRTRRVKTPTLLQMEAVECGAAALGIVLRYHKKIVSLEELREECGVSRDGTKASNLVKAARRYGMVAKGFKKEVEDLPGLTLPMIVFWNFNHYLVVEGFGKGRVYLNDPATGPRVVSDDEFEQSFTGVVLTFEKGPAFEPGGEASGVLQGLAKRLFSSKAALAYVLLLSILLVIPGVVIPTFSRIFIDYYLVGTMKNWIWPLLLGMGLTALMRGVLVWMQQIYLLRLETKMAISSSGQFLWHILHLPISFFYQRYRGDISARMALNDKVAQMLSGELATTFLQSTMFVFFVALMLMYDVLLTVISISIAVFNFLLLRYISRKRTDLNRKLLQERGKMLGVAIGGLQMIESLKAMGAESDFYSRWAGYQAKVLNAEQELGRYAQILTVAPPFLSSVNVVVILSIGSLRVMDGLLTIGMLVAFQSLMQSINEPIEKMMSLGRQLQEATGDLSRLDDVLRHPKDPGLVTEENMPSAQPAPTELSHSQASLQAFGSRQALSLPFVRSGGFDLSNSGSLKLSGLLEVRGLEFGYSRLERPLIQDFHLLVRPGQRVALVGGTGSGKSTIAQLIAGLYHPWSGEILLDGVPMNEIPRQVLTHSLAMVSQDIFLFEGTIKENLTLWNPNIPESQLIRAARDACIHDMIASRVRGYDSLVEEGGTNFSGGQQQRLELARALVGNPSILLLDEATSALDPVFEKQIDNNLRRRGCTCLIVAHRLSTIRDCDEILVLSRGQVVQRGSHEELMAEGGMYSDMIQAQITTPDISG